MINSSSEYLRKVRYTGSGRSVLRRLSNLGSPHLKMRTFSDKSLSKSSLHIFDSSCCLFFSPQYRAGLKETAQLRMRSQVQRCEWCKLGTVKVKIGLNVSYFSFTWSKSSLPGGRESSGPLTSGHWVATKEGEIRIKVRDEDSEATVTASWSGVDGGKSL